MFTVVINVFVFMARLHDISHWHACVHVMVLFGIYVIVFMCGGSSLLFMFPAVIHIVVFTVWPACDCTVVMHVVVALGCKTYHLCYCFSTRLWLLFCQHGLRPCPMIRHLIVVA